MRACFIFCNLTHAFNEVKKLFFIVSWFLCLKISATHIVGGEIIYNQFNDSVYKITLKIYRDCSGIEMDGTGGSGIPNAYLTVLTGGDSLIGVFNMGAPILSLVPPAFSNPCILAPNTTCIQEGIYSYTMILRPRVGGYVLAYQRCCRNGTIVNIVNPGLTGSTYFTRIPGTEVTANNNSPRFKNLPPIYVCNNIPFTFDHSATDPDGDVLKYSICAPYTGLDGCCPFLFDVPPATSNSNCISPPASCPSRAPLPPYSNVTFLPPYSGSYPIASNPAFSIDPTTGILTGVPTINGLWVFGICVEEYRNNQLINTHFRDFQLTVFNCSVTTVAAVPNDGFNKCRGLTVDFGNNSTTTSSIPMTFDWDFGVPNIFSDTSHLATPTFAYPDTGQYMVTLIVNPGKPCTDTARKLVFVYEKFEVDVPHNAKQCLKNNSFNFTVTGENLSPATFTWNFTPIATPSVSNAQSPVNINFSQPGKHVVKLIAQQRTCKDTVIDTVGIYFPPTAKINNLPNSLCDPATVAFSNGSSCDFPLTFNWAFSNGNSSTAYEPTQVFTPVGIYGVTLTAVNNTCKDTAITSVSNVTVNPSPHAGFKLSPEVTSIFDPQITIKNTASSDVQYWEYEFGDGATSIFPNGYHTYQDYGDYVIQQTVTNKFGCKDRTDQVVKILPEFRFWVPNAFTPDENLLNDSFMPVAIGVVNYSFEIFDRWGERIFKTNDLQQGWNGFYKAHPCKQDIYVWRITFTNVVSQKNEVHYGHVTLLRNL